MTMKARRKATMPLALTWIKTRTRAVQALVLLVPQSTLTSSSSFALRNKSGNLSQRTNRGLKRVMSVTSGSVAPKAWEQASENEKRLEMDAQKNFDQRRKLRKRKKDREDFASGSIYEDCISSVPTAAAAETPRSDSVQALNQADGRSGLIYSRSEGTGSKVPAVVPNSTAKAHRGSNFVPDSAQRHRSRTRGDPLANAPSVSRQVSDAITNSKAWREKRRRLAAAASSSNHTHSYAQSRSTNGDSSRRDGSDNTLGSHVQISQPMTTPFVDRTAPAMVPNSQGVSSQEEALI